MQNIRTNVGRHLYFIFSKKKRVIRNTLYVDRNAYWSTTKISWDCLPHLIQLWYSFIYAEDSHFLDLKNWNKKFIQFLQQSCFYFHRQHPRSQSIVWTVFSPGTRMRVCTSRNTPILHFLRFLRRGHIYFLRNHFKPLPLHTIRVNSQL